MTSKERFFVWMWSLVSLVLISLMASILVYNTHYTATVAKIVLEGNVDPIRIKCAMSDSLGNDPVCVMLVTNDTVK
jgi:hypothetical protein